ncbi:MAG: chromate transporter [Butyricicoccus sp.]
MIYITLFFTFARIALCTLGGGSATIPYLMELPDQFGWVTSEQLATIIAVGESAPGPGGVNMASYIGFEAAGIGGVLASVAGLCLPSVLLVTAIAAFLHGIQHYRLVKQFFYGLRPAVVASIAAAVLRLMNLMLMQDGQIYWKAAAIYVLGMVFTRIPRCKQIPLVFPILAAGLCGILFQI